MATGLHREFESIAQWMTVLLWGIEVDSDDIALLGVSLVDAESFIILSVP